MIFEAGTVEGHARDARALRLLGNAFADELRRFDVAAVYAETSTLPPVLSMIWA
jgi:hypothetical protein